MEKNFNEEILQTIAAINGMNEDYTTKACIGFSVEKWTQKETDVTRKVLKNLGMTGPICNVSIANDEFVVLELVFPKIEKPSLHLLWNALNKYPYYIKEDSMTFARFVVMPKEFKGFYLEFNSPIFYALQSTDVNETPNSIKLLFKADTVTVYYSDDIKLDEIDKEIENSNIDEEFLNDKLTETFDEKDANNTTSIPLNTEKPQKRYKVYEE